MEMSLEAKLRFWCASIQRYVKIKGKSKKTRKSLFAQGVITGLLLASSDIKIMLEMSDRINYRDIVSKYKLDGTENDVSINNIINKTKVK